MSFEWFDSFAVENFTVFDADSIGILNRNKEIIFAEISNLFEMDNNDEVRK